MGLDMYLRAEAYVSGSGVAEHTKEDYALLLETFADGTDREAFRSVQYPHAEVSFLVCYWRKANQIHSWFVRECQGGVDECQVTHVSRNKLKELREVCLRVLAAKPSTVKAEELLAPRGGFFFGNVEYNDWYWEHLQDTVKQLDRAIALSRKWDLSYQSSW